MSPPFIVYSYVSETLGYFFVLVLSVELISFGILFILKLTGFSNSHPELFGFHFAK